MGRVKSSVLFSFESVKCPCYLFAKDANKRTCCNDEHEVIKIEDDHAASHIVALWPDYFVVGEVFSQVFSAEPRQEFLTSFDENPPPPNPIPLFTKYCSLVFYDDMTS
jgi:hypothetical protein